MPRATAFRASHRGIIEKLLASATYRDACAAVGIPWQTWMEWCRAVKEGRCNDPDVEALVNDARQAYGAASVGLMAQVKIASAKDWKAAAWLLDHRRGDPKAASDARRARHEAAAASDRSGQGTTADVVYVPAVLATPRTEPK